MGEQDRLISDEARIGQFAARLLEAGPGFGEPMIEVFDDLARVATEVESWRIERLSPTDLGLPDAAYRIYLARPAIPGAVRVRAFAQLVDATTYDLADQRGLAAFAASRVADPLTIAQLTARFADPADHPRRILTDGDLAPAVVGADGEAAVIIVHTARTDHTADETRFDRIERWRVLLTPAGVTWSIEAGGG